MENIVKYISVDSIEEFMNDLLKELCKNNIDYVCIKETFNYKTELLYYELHVKNNIYRISDKLLQIKMLVEEANKDSNQSDISYKKYDKEEKQSCKRYTKQLRKYDNNKYKIKK